MTPDDRWLDLARFDAAHANRLWDGTAPTDDAPAWYGRVSTLLRGARVPATADELAAESEIVAKMQAVILDPAPADESAGESDIVSRMQAVILESAWAADGDEVGDANRPRHLRAPVPLPPGARRRQGARVVRRIVAVKAAAVTTVVAIGVTAAAATTGFVATVVVPALSDHPPRVPVKHEAPTASDDESSTGSSGGSGDGAWGGTGDDPIVSYDEKPFVCMINLDCLLEKVEQEAAAAPAPPATAGEPSGVATPPADGATVDATAVPDPSPTTTTTEPTPTTTTTEPPATTTTTTEPPPTTTTTAPPPPDPPAAEVAGPPSPPAQPTGGTTMSAAGVGDAGAGGTPPAPAG